MCKLASISLDKKYNNDPAIPSILLRELLIVQSDKFNIDGTGIGICDKRNLWVKHYEPAQKFVFSPQVTEYLDKYANHSTLIGHVRNATNGDKEDNHYLQADAHPFVYNNIMGVHNGHFGNYLEVLAEQSFDLNGSTIDSAVFFKYLAEILENKPFNVEALNKTIASFEGSFTLLIHDALQPGIVWAAKGNNMLSKYLWEELGILIVATSSTDIKDAIASFVPRYNLYKGGNLTVPNDMTATTLTINSLYKIEGTKIEKVSDLESCKYIPTKYVRTWTGGEKKPKQAQLRAEVLIELEGILGIDNYGELDIVFKASGIESWWERDSDELFDIVSIVDNYLTNVLTIQKSPEHLEKLTKLWEKCKAYYRMLNDEPVNTLDCYVGITSLIEDVVPDFYVPYFFNEEKTLSTIKNYISQLISRVHSSSLEKGK